MPHRVNLNVKQQSLLRWIADGCPDGVMPDDAHRISAAALRNRGLVQISGRGQTWKARITPEGLAYLESLTGNGATPPAPATPSRALQPRATAKPQAAVMREDLHPVAADFQSRLERHEVSRAQLPRAVALLQALVREAVERGWTVTLATDSENEFGLVDWSSAKDGHMTVDVGDQRFWLRVQEEGVHTRGALEDGDDISYDRDGTGRLKLEVRWGEWFTRQQTRWVDRESSPLEARLPEFFAAIELRVVEGRRLAGEKSTRAVRMAADERDQAQERERQWTLHMAHARERYVEAARSQALNEQMGAWNEARCIRSYCDALAASYPDDPGTQAWIAWARVHADQIDPTVGQPRTPTIEEPAPGALQPYLPEGWSASGA